MLRTHESLLVNHNKPKWRNQDFPIAFLHVEGDEMSQSVATDQGNENSKSNEAEVQTIVSSTRTHLSEAGLVNTFGYFFSGASFQLSCQHARH